MIRLIINHALLSAALRTFLTSRGAVVGVDGEVAPGDVVITTTADTSPGGCRRLVDTGARVMILAANGTEASESRFFLAGAEGYLEMSADASPLIDAVNALTSPLAPVPSVEKVTPRAARPPGGQRSSQPVPVEPVRASRECR